MSKPLTVAVTGINAHDNPGPGVAVAMSLRASPEFTGRIVGLAYDSLEPGIYAREIIDDVFLLPYPAHGREGLEARIRYIHERVGLDAIFPNLDSELPLFIDMEPALRELGIGLLLPSNEQLALRAKSSLYTLGKNKNLPVPFTKVLNSVQDLYAIESEVTYPFYLKGVFYGAKLVRSIDEAYENFHKIAAQWGFPILAQAAVTGEEQNVIGVGDGKGNLIGAMAMRKTYVTDKGKGWAGVSLKAPDLIRLAGEFVKATNWRGPFEYEALKDEQGKYHLIEINPRFPAWVYLTAGSGYHLPWAALQVALGGKAAPLGEYQAGKMFVRIALDQIVDLEDFQKIATVGEIVNS